jgi:hypothetical protein
MPYLPLRPIVLSACLVLSATFAVAAKTPHAKTLAPRPAAAAPAVNFDGRWSVVIITDAGSCDRAYRYGVRIQGGRVSYAGDASVSFSGTVSNDGRVSVSVRAGSQSASGSGRLSGNSGGGTWSGASPNNRCSGTWEAERR